MKNRKVKFATKIKDRILFFFMLFVLIAYSTIMLVNYYIYKKELIKLKTAEIQQTFANGMTKIQALSSLMEHKAMDLAFTGERFYQLKHRYNLSVEDVKQFAGHYLTDNFTSFPEAIGGGIWYRPYALDQDTKYFGPYAYRQDNHTVLTWALSEPSYDYPNESWYQIAVKNHWGKDQKRLRPLFWTDPYVDPAATHALMMTVDVVMYDSHKKPIGMATVDWALADLTDFLTRLNISSDTTPFLIRNTTGQFVSFPQDPKLVLQRADQFPWGKLVLNNKHLQKLQVIDDVIVNQKPYRVYFINTNNGFTFGLLIPEADLVKDINQVTNLTVLLGIVIGILFMLIAFPLMKVVFSPFDKVLARIKHSIVYHTEDDGVEIIPIKYEEKNEFTPITQALDDIYQQLDRYMHQLNESNQQLRQSEAVNDKLNSELEKKVELRTEQLEKKTQEALNSLQQLKATQQQLIENEKHAALGRLVAGVAHEINTPLGISVTAASTIQDQIELIQHNFNQNTLKKAEFSENCHELIEISQILVANLQRASELIRNFKQVAVDQSSVKFDHFYLYEYLAKIIRLLKPKITNSGHQVEFAFLEDDISVYTDPGALAQIITNIIDNALIHAFPANQAGLIEINADKHNQDVVIKIKDNGVGMKPEVVNLIFDPFFTTARQTGGTGLGMHIVYNLVTQYLKGTIECESEPGKGTVFTITFPIKKPPHEPLPYS